MNSLYSIFTYSLLFTLMCRCITPFEELQTNNALTENERMMIDSIVNKFLAYPNDKMWSVVDDISLQSPLFFLHQRKNAGTTLRSALNNTATKEGLPVFIPCYRDVHCNTFHIPEIAEGSDIRAAIFAGHFEWNNMLSARGTIGRNISCFTNFRNPQTRVISCLYFNMFRVLTMKHRCLMDLSLDEMDKLLRTVFRHGYSCINEPFRILSGVEDEDWLLTLDAVDSDKQDEDTHWYNRNIIRRRKQRRLLGIGSIAILEKTLMHITKCAPVIAELPASYQLLQDRFPRLAQHGTFDPDRKENVDYFNSTHCEKVHGAHMKLVHRYSRLETILYHAVVKKVHSRLRETNRTDSSHQYHYQYQHHRHHPATFPLSSIQ